ncbi:hypothetical protein LXL04_034600 [Taraxacum kok-saghyz]
MATLSSISGLASAMGPALDTSSKIDLHVNGMAQIKQAAYGNVDMNFVLGVGGYDIDRIDSEIPSDGSHCHEHEHGHEFLGFQVCDNRTYFFEAHAKHGLPLV